MRFSKALILISFTLLFTGTFMAYASNNSTNMLLDDLPAPLIYKELFTNQTLQFNYTNLQVANNRAYYIIQANTTHSLYLPLSFSFQIINKTFIMPIYHYKFINCTLQSTLQSTTYYMDRITGLITETIEQRIISIPELNITNQKILLTFGSLNPSILVTNQAYNIEFKQSLPTAIPTTLNESLQSIFSLYDNISAILSQTITSQFMNSSLVALINLQSHQISSFNETINNQSYAYSLLQTNNSQSMSNSINTESLLRSMLSTSSLPGFELLSFALLPIIIAITRLRTR